MINSEEISVVIQGSVNPEITNECIISVRKIHPKSEVILSTWEGSDLDSIDLTNVDLVHLSKDPGGRVYSSDGNINNVARQITSTLEGLKKATKKYAFKIRSDIILKGDSHLAYFDRFGKYNHKYKIFDKRILICSNYTLNSKTSPVLFHPSDWVSFGKIEDMLKMWDIPIPTESDYQYFKNKKKPDGVVHPYILGRYFPEQYIFLTCVKKYISNIELPKQYYDSSDKLVATSNQLIMNNFVVLDYRKIFKIEFKKYNPEVHYTLWNLNFLSWVKSYNELFLAHEKIPLRAWLSDVTIRKPLSQGAIQIKNKINSNKQYIIIKWFFIKKIRDINFAYKKYILCNILKVRTIAISLLLWF